MLKYLGWHQTWSHMCNQHTPTITLLLLVFTLERWKYNSTLIKQLCITHLLIVYQTTRYLELYHLNGSNVCACVCISLTAFPSALWSGWRGGFVWESWVHLRSFPKPEKHPHGNHQRDRDSVKKKNKANQDQLRVTSKWLSQLQFS